MDFATTDDLVRFFFLIADRLQAQDVQTAALTLRRDGFDGFGAQCDLRDFWRHELINS